MQCPVCQSSLTPVTVGDVKVDACADGCGGVWFDHRELQKMDEPNEPGEALLTLHPASGTQTDASRRRKCPVCADTVMMQHYMTPRREVLLDECPACGGYWLDAGELEQLREENAKVKAAKAEPAKASTPAIDRPIPPQVAEELAETRFHEGTIARVARFLSFRLS